MEETWKSISSVEVKVVSNYGKCLIKKKLDCYFETRWLYIDNVDNVIETHRNSSTTKVKITCKLN